ncbi:hypothetical protein BSK59_13820 [Paenibacillus odorifer]|uniref:hypothetical protein n=1 Tax=Paenibacillus odorifer TaxID=189426 RepID=UPI0009700435|nr:hypothetical protein [Paenibacillus odorifer]OME55549.1 hypothetical protein BSK59_13820 [Paenibacillus odorifer]
MKNKNIHEWFALSYSSYLVLQRSALQSMPEEWQQQFVKLLDKLNDHGYYQLMPEGSYDFMVKLRNKDGKFIKDPLVNYDRGRRNLNIEMQQKNSL